MTRIARLALLVAGLGLGPATSAYAQTATASLSVGATVSSTCSIGTVPVAFGAYDPVVAHAATPLDGTGAVVVTCTRGAGTRVDLDRGSNPQGQIRRMAGTGDLLRYELYRNATRTSVWRRGVTGLAIPAAPSTTPRTFVVYGRIPAGQDVSAGSYSDAVVATINF